MLTGLERFVRLVVERETWHTPSHLKSPRVFGAPRPYAGLYSPNSYMANRPNYTGLSSSQQKQQHQSLPTSPLFGTAASPPPSGGSQSTRQAFLTSPTPGRTSSSSVGPSPLPTQKNAVAILHPDARQAAAGEPSSSIVINVKNPDGSGALSALEFPPVPTQLGQVTETITKSTLTETIVTRVTNNRLGALPIIIEVSCHSIQCSWKTIVC